MPFPPPPAPPAWISQPSTADLVRAEALHGGWAGGGKAVMRCYVRLDGRLDACEFDAAQTTFSLAKAALSLQTAYRLDLAAGAALDRIVVTLVFPRGPDVAPKIVAEPPPAETLAAAPAGISGEVEVACAVTASGAPEACEVERTPAHDARLDAGALALAGRYRFAPARLGSRDVASFATIRVGVGTPPRVVVAPTFARRPTAEDLANAYPEMAQRVNVSGRATIHCAVPVTGGLRDCRVVEEAPAGYGFGLAVLKLADKFVVKAGAIDGKPVASELSIPVSMFTGESVRAPRAGLKLLPWAPWTRAPTAQDVATAFPQKQASAGVYGVSNLLCGIGDDGLLKDCRPSTFAPSTDFDVAARSLAPRFQVDTRGFAAKDLRSLRVAVAVDFSERTLRPDARRSLRTMDWVRAADDVAMGGAYPTAAMKAGVLSGVATVDCDVGDAGALKACETVSEAPTDLGFAQAALQVAPLMQANLWTRDGEPAVGQKVRVPLHFIATTSGAAAPGAPRAREPALKLEP